MVGGACAPRRARLAVFREPAECSVVWPWRRRRTRIERYRARPFPACKSARRRPPDRDGYGGGCQCVAEAWCEGVVHVNFQARTTPACRRPRRRSREAQSRVLMTKDASGHVGGQIWT
jgi:hypothetical protein